MVFALETLLFTYCIYFLIGLEGNEFCIIRKNFQLQVQDIENQGCCPRMMYNQGSSSQSIQRADPAKSPRVTHCPGSPRTGIQHLLQCGFSTSECKLHSRCRFCNGIGRMDSTKSHQFHFISAPSRLYKAIKTECLRT